MGNGMEVGMPHQYFSTHSRRDRFVQPVLPCVMRESKKLIIEEISVRKMCTLQLASALKVSCKFVRKKFHPLRINFYYWKRSKDAYIRARIVIAN